MPKKKNKAKFTRGDGGGGEGGAEPSAAVAAEAAEIVSAGATIKAMSSGFRFQDGVVEDDIIKDMKSLKSLNVSQLTELVSMSLDFLTLSDGTVIAHQRVRA